MYERFTDRARKVMQLANQEAQRFNHEYIGTEHVLLGLIKEGSGVAANVLKNLDVDLRKIHAEIEKIVMSGPDMVTLGKLPQTPRVKKVIEYSIEEAHLEHNYVGTEHLLLGLLREQEGVASQVLMNLGLKLEGVREEVLNLLGQTHSTPESIVNERHAKQVKPRSALDRFGHDLTALARQSKLDPFIGRESDPDQLLRILCRRTRNRPLLLGEAGVGKSALVRGLAFRLEGLLADHLPLDVHIRGHRLVRVDLPALLASANRVRVEERIRAIADEARKEKVILFLDDFHLWAASQPALYTLASVLDAIPFCIAATTPTGFTRLVEKLSTLERSFRPVQLSPLAPPDVLRVLFSIRDRIEAHHRVCIKEEALRAAIESATKVGTWGASLIDLALDVIDETAAAVRQRAMTRPPDLQALDAQIEKLILEKDAAVEEQDFDRAAALRDQGEQLRKRREALVREWVEKRKEGDGIVDAEAIREFAQQTFGYWLEPF